MKKKHRFSKKLILLTWGYSPILPDPMPSCRIRDKLSQSPYGVLSDNESADNLP